MDLALRTRHSSEEHRNLSDTCSAIHDHIPWARREVEAIAADHVLPIAVDELELYPACHDSQRWKVASARNDDLEYSKRRSDVVVRKVGVGEWLAPEYGYKVVKVDPWDVIPPMTGHSDKQSRVEHEPARFVGKHATRVPKKRCVLSYPVYTHGHGASQAEAIRKSPPSAPQLDQPTGAAEFIGVPVEFRI